MAQLAMSGMPPMERISVMVTVKYLQNHARRPSDPDAAAEETHSHRIYPFKSALASRKMDVIVCTISIEPDEHASITNAHLLPIASDLVMEKVVQIHWITFVLAFLHAARSDSIFILLGTLHWHLPNLFATGRVMQRI
jgi:hypothetical protein